jgi:hypothetical protein
MSCRRRVEIQREIGDVPCGREVRVKQEKTRWREDCGARVYRVHWRRALGGTLISLVALIEVVWDQKGDVLTCVPTKRICGLMADLQ